MRDRTSGPAEPDAQPPPPSCLVLSVAHPGAYVAHARSILGRMGYGVVDASAWTEDPESYAGKPRLVIVDERMLADVPEEGALARLPRVLLTGRRGVEPGDPRVLGAIRKPAGLHELYRLMQRGLEDHPRSSPRVPTNLAAHIHESGRRWKGAVLSLSENGCLLRTHERVALGARVRISFDLPQAGRIETLAETSYQLVPDLGLVFQSTPAPLREAIRGFVAAQLAPA